VLLNSCQVRKHHSIAGAGTVPREYNTRVPRARAQLDKSSLSEATIALSPKQGDMATKCVKEYQIHSDVEFTDMSIC